MVTNTKADFAALMLAHNVPVDNAVVVGSTGYLDQPRRGAFYTGHDAQGRAFICLTVTLVRHDDHTYVPAVEGRTRNKTHTFTVFERYNDRETLYCTLGNQPKLVTGFAFLGRQNNDLTTLTALTALLNGESIKFYDFMYVDGCDKQNPDVWVEIALVK